MKRLVFTTILSLTLVMPLGTALAKTELVLWHGIESPDSIKVLEEKIAAFETKAGIGVKLMHYGAADQVSGKIMTAVAGNKAPDLMWWGPMNTGQMAKTGKLVKIQELIDADQNFDKNDVYQGLWDGGSYDGSVWTFPFAANNVALYYNKKHFEEAGLDPAGLKTWDDLVAYAGKLTGDDRVGMEVSIGTGEWMTFSTLLPFLWQAGGKFISEDGKTILFNSEAGVRALEFLASLVNEHKVAKWSEIGAGYKIDNFLAGRVSMMICGPWNLGALKKQDKVEYGAIMLPKDKIFATDLGGENLYLFKSDAEREKAAWELCKFIASTEFQVDWAIATGYLPISKSAAADPRYQAFLAENPFVRTFSEQMQYAMARPSVPGYQKVSDEFSKAADMVFYGKMSAQDALDKAAEKSKRYLR